MDIEVEHLIDKIFIIEIQYPALKDRLKEYLNLLMGLAQADAGAIFLWEEFSQKMRLSYYKGINYNAIKALNRASPQDGGQGLAQKTANEKKPIIIEDLFQILNKPFSRAIEQSKIKSIMSLPLMMNSHLLGILQIGKTERCYSWEKETKSIYSLCRAITQTIYRDKLEKQVKRTKEYLGNLLSSSPSSIITTDQHGNFSFINPATEEIFGYPAPQLLGKSVKDFYVGGEAKAREIMELLKEKGKIKNWEVQFYKSDGSKAYVRLSAALIKDDKGKITGTIGICDDISERKKLEKKMRGQAQYLANIMADSADAIISIDNGNIIQSWNKGAVQIFGYTSKEMIGQSFDRIVPKELMDKQELEKIKQEVYDKGYIRNYETYRIRKDGRKIFVNITRTAIKDEKGIIIGSSAIIRDITGMKELQRELIHSEKLATVGRLAAALAHEIKNPLAGISGAIQVIGETLPSEDSRQDIIKEILRQTKRLDNTINALLIYSKPRPINKVYYNIHSLLDKVLIVLQQEPQMKKVEIVRSYDNRLTKAYIDPQKMEQVFINLIINSIQAMPKGGRLTISTSQQRNKQLISFADTGIGIPAEKIRDIFKPFFTTKHRGAGLGLNISYNIVKFHSGALKVESEVGKGSKFTIVLPRVDSND